MFGRARPASSSLESLEAERSSSKSMNSQPLSIYETTLMKLREGSRAYSSRSKAEGGVSSSGLFAEDAMDVDDGCDSGGLCIPTSSCDTGRKSTKMLTISELFSRYKTKHNPLSEDKLMISLHRIPIQDETFQVHVQSC